MKIRSKRREGAREEGKRRGRERDKTSQAEELLKVGGRVKQKNGTKETENKRKRLDLIPGALEYTCFPEAVLFDSPLKFPEDSAKLKAPARSTQGREAMTDLPCRCFLHGHFHSFQKFRFLAPSTSNQH